MECSNNHSNFFFLPLLLLQVKDSPPQKKKQKNKKTYTKRTSKLERFSSTTTPVPKSMTVDPCCCRWRRSCEGSCYRRRRLEGGLVKAAVGVRCQPNDTFMMSWLKCSYSCPEKKMFVKGHIK